MQLWKGTKMCVDGGERAWGVGWEGGVRNRGARKEAVKPKYRYIRFIPKCTQKDLWVHCFYSHGLAL